MQSDFSFVFLFLFIFFSTDDLPAVVTLVCKFLYLSSSSHIDSNVPPYWPDQYEFVVLSSTRAHVVYQSALTAAPQYYNLLQYQYLYLRSTMVYHE